MRFGAPWNFWLLLLMPLLAAFLGWSMVARRRALRCFVHPEMVDRLTRAASSVRQYGKAFLTLAGILLLVLALTGPQFGAKLEVAQQRGVDLVIALDLSRSMLAEDIRPNRLEWSRHQIRQLLDRLAGHRVGLVVFAGQAFVQCPLTLDYGAFEMFLEAVDPTTVPVQGTAIGEALRVAMRSFDESERRSKAILLFSDGEDREGSVAEAAEEAARHGVRIFTIGVGTLGGELIPGRDEQGSPRFHRDGEGNVVKTRLEETRLRQIALVTDGDYFRSQVSGVQLDALYDRLATMDQKDFGARRFVQYEERFQLPLLLAIGCFLAEALLGDGRKQHSEWKGRFR